MSIPGFTAESSLCTRGGAWHGSVHPEAPGEVVPQVASRVCTKCDGIFYGSHICCDIEIVNCTKEFQNCVVNFKNCVTESCGFLVDVGNFFSTIF
jgi:hypothetical protein